MSPLPTVRIARPCVLALLLSMSLAPSGDRRILAQVLPLGPDVQVNTYTTGVQLLPQIAMAGDGTFVVFWCCGWLAHESRSTLAGQLFAPDGTRIGVEFAADEHSPSFPAGVAVEGDGDILLVWGDGDFCPTCIGDYVKGRRFAADGTPRGAQFEISPPPGGDYTGDADVLPTPGGGFVVAWYDYGLFARRYDTNAVAIGETFPIAGATGFGREPSLSASLDGGFVVAWQQPGYGVDVIAHRYDGEGEPIGAPILVADRELFWALTPDVAPLANGGFVVVWTTDDWAAKSIAFESRRYDSSGGPLEPGRRIGASARRNPYRAQVHREADDGYVVVWDGLSSTGGDDDLESVSLRRFAGDGTPLGRELRANSGTASFQRDPQIAVAPDGDLVAVWSSGNSAGTDQSVSSIQMRRFRPPFFTDGLEAGDTSRWSATSPSPTASRLDSRRHDR